MRVTQLCVFDLSVVIYLILCMRSIIFPLIWFVLSLTERSAASYWQKGDTPKRVRWEMCAADSLLLTDTKLHSWSFVMGLIWQRSSAVWTFSREAAQSLSHSACQDHHKEAAWPLLVCLCGSAIGNRLCSDKRINMGKPECGNAVRGYGHKTCAGDILACRFCVIV